MTRIAHFATIVFLLGFGGAAFAQAPVAPVAPEASARPPAAKAAPALPWPTRIAPVGHEGAMGLIRTLEAPDGLSGFQTNRFRVANPSVADKEDGTSLAGERPLAFEGANAFLFSRARPQPKGAKGPKRPQAIEYFKFVSGEEGDPNGDGVRPVRIQRTWFALYDQSTESTPRGTALVMPGLFNTPEPVIEYLVSSLRDHGWIVLRMMAQPSRFTEQVEFKIDADHLEASAESVAAVLQDRAAECALSTQAAFDHVISAHPDWAKLPRIALGMSGGAMTLPTVVAREPGKYAAAVLIAGGSNLLAIITESNYRFLVNATTFEWSAPATPALNDQLKRLYLEKAPLDPYTTAAALAGKPVLMIHGTHDGAVPSYLGDELWERLGKPERWSEESGHEEIFMHLPQKAGKICDWLAEKTAPKPTP